MIKKYISSVRLLLLIVIISINLFLNTELNITYVKLSFFDNFSIEGFSFFLTLICFYSLLTLLIFLMESIYKVLD